MNFLKKGTIIIGLIFCKTMVFAQPKIVMDKVVAVVGDHVVLQSDVENTFSDYIRQDPNLSDTIKCSILEGLLSKSLLCEQAARDSIKVTDEEVDAMLDNRIRYFIQQYGSEEKMQEVIGKTTYQLKDDYRKVFQDDILANRMQSQVMADVKISPAEVRTYFSKIPKDSLPYFPSQVEVGQLVLTPIASKTAEDYALQQLLDIREQITSGKTDFETMAGIYNTDATKDQGGDLGIMTREELVPEFSAVAFRLQTGEISQPVKTRFGYHLVQMVKRMGEKARLRHILIRPAVTSDELVLCLQKLDSIKAQIETGKITFIEAVNKFSSDERTKNSGGMFSSNSTGNSLLLQEELEPDVVLEINKMTAGTYSKGMVFASDPKGEDKMCRFLFLKNITEPHIADINLDYSRIQQAALVEKQNKNLVTWIETKIGEFYVNVDNDFIECNSVSRWMKAKTKE
jgi:peptidyl-prolyl cis-trans isomerase SurA